MKSKEGLFRHKINEAQEIEVDLRVVRRVEVEVINGFLVISRYPDISKEENERRMREAFEKLYNLFKDRITENVS